MPRVMLKLYGQEEAFMKIRLNDDAEIVKTIREGLKARDGHCPCRREISEDTK